MTILSLLFLAKEAFLFLQKEAFFGQSAGKTDTANKTYLVADYVLNIVNKIFGYTVHS